MIQDGLEKSNTRLLVQGTLNIFFTRLHGRLGAGDPDRRRAAVAPRDGRGRRQ